MYRILVVEDEDDIQKILENYLIDQGYAVTLAYDGVDGIAKFHNGEFDLVAVGCYDAKDRRFEYVN